MTNILYVVSDFNEDYSFNGKNLGDLLVLKGAKHLLQKTYGKHNAILFDKYIAYGNNNYLDFFKNIDIDILAVVGSPWLHGFDTEKYRVLTRLLKMPNIENAYHKIAVGIGSAISLNEKIVIQPEWKVWKSFDKIIVRDSTAGEILNKMKIDYHYGLCQSYFYKYVMKKVKKEELYTLSILYNPYTGICDKLEKNYKDAILSYQFAYGADKVVSTQDYELDISNNCHRIRTLDNLVKVISKAKYILTGRVHPAVMCILLNKKFCFIPVDSRKGIIRGMGGVIKDIFGKDKYSYKFRKPNEYADLKINISFYEQKEYLMR